jgi:hypothetical protein
MKKLLAVFVALLLLGVVATGVAAQSGGAGFYDFETSVRAWQNLIVYGDITARDDLTVTDQLVTQGDITLSDDLTVGDIAEVGKLRVTLQPTITVAASANISPTGTYQRISAAGAVGTSSIQAGTAGDVLVLINTGSNTITLTDTATLMLSANVVLGPKGNVTLISAGADGWYEVATMANGG